MELNNRTLVYLVSIALLITLFGTIISLTRLQDIHYLTGLATSGPVNVTVTTTAAINLTQHNINWGAGTVNPGQTNAVLDTFGTPYVARGSWGTSGVDGFELQNIGNVVLNITINSTETASTYIGGSSPAFNFHVTNATGNGSCVGVMLTGEQAFPANDIKTAICHKLNFTTNNDFLTIDINITVPEDAPTGSKNTTIYFDACDVSAGSCTP